jgi:hypothetical protein
MRTLKKLGFVFSADEIFDIDVNIYSVIDDELAKIEKEEMRKSRKK